MGLWAHIPSSMLRFLSAWIFCRFHADYHKHCASLYLSVLMWLKNTVSLKSAANSSFYALSLLLFRSLRFRWEGCVSDIPFRAEYRHVSYSLCINQLYAFVLIIIHLKEAGSLLRFEGCTDLWVWQYVIANHFIAMYFNQSNTPSPRSMIYLTTGFSSTWQCQVGILSHKANLKSIKSDWLLPQH